MNARPLPPSSVPSLDAALREAARAEVQRLASELAKPEYVTQRTVTAVVGVERRAYLRAGRRGDFPTWRQHKAIYAKRVDVERWVEANPARPTVPSGPRVPPADESSDPMEVALARCGARRVVPPPPLSVVSKR